MRAERLYAALGVFAGMALATLAGLALWGWCWNILKLAEMDASPLTAMFVLRVLGVLVPPLGAVMGYA